MPHKSIPIRLLHPESPSFSKDCVANDPSRRKGSTIAKLGDFLTIVKLGQAERLQKKEFAIAVMGPVICDACVHSCTKATVLVPSGATGDGLLRGIAFDTVKEATTSTSARQILNPPSQFRNRLTGRGIISQGLSQQSLRRSGEQVEEVQLFDVERQGQDLEPFVSSRDRDMSQMIDVVLELQAEQPVTISPRGELVAHQDGFQPELPFGPAAVPAEPYTEPTTVAEFTVVEGPNNQFRLEF